MSILVDRMDITATLHRMQMQMRGIFSAKYFTVKSQIISNTEKAERFANYRKIETAASTCNKAYDFIS